MQFREGDFGGRALGIVLVVELDGRRNAAAVVNHAHGVVHVDGDVDLGGKAGHGLVDGVVHDFVHEVMKTGAVRDVADVHPRALTNCFETFEDLDVAFVVSARDVRLDFLIRHSSLNNLVKNCAVCEGRLNDERGLFGKGQGRAHRRLRQASDAHGHQNVAEELAVGHRQKRGALRVG